MGSDALIPAFTEKYPCAATYLDDRCVGQQVVKHMIELPAVGV
jgi:hypothetical protein